MVYIEHKETVQVTISKATMSKGLAFLCLRLIKLTTAIDERHGIIFDLLCECQQLLGIRFGIPRVNGSLLFQFLLFQQKLLVIRVIEPCLQSRHALRLACLHRCNDSSAGINPPCRIRFPYLCPELFLCARKSLGKVSILLKCNHSVFCFLT